MRGLWKQERKQSRRYTLRWRKRRRGLHGGDAQAPFKGFTDIRFDERLNRRVGLQFIGTSGRDSKRQDCAEIAMPTTAPI
jgi:hypothetical protein